MIAVGADRSVTIAWRAAKLDSEGEGSQSGALDVRTRHTSGALSDTQRVSSAPAGSYRLADRAAGTRRPDLDAAHQRSAGACRRRAARRDPHHGWRAVR